MLLSGLSASGSPSGRISLRSCLRLRLGFTQSGECGRLGHRCVVISTWIAGQLFALGLCAFLYFTQIRQLSQYFGGQDATQGWMGKRLPQPLLLRPR